MKISLKKKTNIDIKKHLEKKLSAKLSLEVGFFESAKYQNGKAVAQVAVDNEYGTTSKLGNVHIPPRPFFRTAVDENSKEWMELFEATYKQTKNMEKTLGIVGTIASNDIATSIINFSEPQNSDFTKDRKNSSNPLVDTGKLSESVTHKITERGK